MHGNTNKPLTIVDDLATWENVLDHNNFFTDECVIVWPLYFGYTFQLPYRMNQDPPYPDDPQYESTCETVLYNNSIPRFSGNRVTTPNPNINKQFQDDLAPDYSINDAQIMAILQSLALVFGEQTALGLNLNGNLGILGGSKGANMLYDVAPILYENGAPGTLKVCAALYGGTDQYAPFNVRRSKRYLASALKYTKSFQGGLWTRKWGYTYNDILTNQIERTLSDGVKLYLHMQDPSLPPPSEFPDPLPTLSELKTLLRRWFLEDSVARIWDYSDGPYPLQVNHGTSDDIVYVQNSRWLFEKMRMNDAPFETYHIKYSETPFGGHGRGMLSQTSMDTIASLLAQELG